MSATVAAVMLVSGRHDMARRAVECVRQQTYGSLSLILLDTGAEPFRLEWAIETYRQAPSQTIGELRNRANALTDADIIVHFDSDDWSHPRRIEEQVALLQASGADAVGYNEALFWREAYGEAILYRNEDPRYCLGASLCYWRKTWERKPFDSTSQGEDFRFCLGLKTVGVSSLYKCNRLASPSERPELEPQPRFIARIHPHNTSNAYAEDTIARASEWRLVPEWDGYCRERMAL